MVDFTIPVTGTYDITAAGAEGRGNIVGSAGGLGALAGGDVFLIAGAVLDVAVGSGSGGAYAGGGGGGSFVYTSLTAPLVVAGGGGGGGAAAAAARSSRRTSPTPSW